MSIAWIPALVCLLGLLLFVLATNPKASAIGTEMFWCGLLVLLFSLSGHAISLAH